MKFSGGIPERITIISSGEDKVNWRFDDLAEAEDDEKRPPVVVVPAFVSDATNEKTLETGREWANRRGIWRNGTWEHSGEIKEETKDNTPFVGLRVVNLVVRSEGGRAWKVMTQEGYYFDLREDILLEAMIACGVEEHGYLGGEYIWGKVGSQMKIIRVGSHLYNRLIESNDRKALKKISSKQLLIGGVYETKSGQKYIFCGWVQTVGYDSHYEYDRGNYNHLDYSQRYYYTKNPIKKGMLVFKVYPHEKDPDFGLGKALSEEAAYQFEVKKDSSLVLKSGQVDVPNDIVFRLRNMVIQHAIKERNSYVIGTGRPFPQQGHERRSLGVYLTSRSYLVNMSDIDQPLVVHDAFNELPIREN